MAAAQIDKELEQPTLIHEAPELGPVQRPRRSGDEPFRSRDAPVDFNLLDFWGWSGSDLVSNATRGRIAEFIVANACGIPTNDVRDEWAAYDLELTPHGHGIEVRSAAYLQSWHQKCLSPITFSVRKARAWDRKTNKLAENASRSATLYVFALLAHKEKKTLDPLNVDQWEFYVVPTSTLDERKRSQHSITLPSLKRLKAGPHSYGNLREAVRRADREATKKLLTEGEILSMELLADFLKRQSQ